MNEIDVPTTVTGPLERRAADGALPFWRTIVPGRDTLPRGFCLPRHRHLEPYALVVIAGAFEQTSYGGRVTVRTGDLLVQPT